MMNVLSLVVGSLLALTTLHAYSDERPIQENDIATLRQGVPLSEENPKPALLKNPGNTDRKRARTFPMQPPTIPHKIDAYQVDLRVNTCLSCHSRKRTQASQAPMVSVTHFMDRDGNFLADVSPRRYFCQQCHITQVDHTELVNNGFKDIHDVLRQGKNGLESNK